MYIIATIPKKSTPDGKLGKPVRREKYEHEKHDQSVHMKKLKIWEESRLAARKVLLNRIRGRGLADHSTTSSRAKE